MNANLRIGAILLVGCGLGACTSQEVTPTPGNGGTSGGGAGTSGGGAGNTGSAGNSGGLPGNNGVACPAPTMSITNFTFDPDGGSMTEARFGTPGTTLSGGQSAYGQLTSNITGNDWHLTGMITDYSGFNLYFDDYMMCNRLDASAFGGISFTIWGTTTGNLTFGMGTVDDTVKSAWLDSIDAGTGMVKPGNCMPTSGNGPYYHPGCADPMHTFALTGTMAAPQTVSLRWGDFAGGQPVVGVTPANILSVYWNVAWTPGQASYPVDIHIDNLTFIQ